MRPTKKISHKIVTKLMMQTVLTGFHFRTGWDGGWAPRRGVEARVIFDGVCAAVIPRSRPVQILINLLLLGVNVFDKIHRCSLIMAATTKFNTGTPARDRQRSKARCHLSK